MEQIALTGMDRCDRCRAPARARTQHGNGTLLWCAHHYEEHEDALTPFLVYYQTDSDDDIKEPAPA